MLDSCDIGRLYMESKSTKKMGEWFTDAMFNGPASGGDPAVSTKEVKNFLEKNYCTTNFSPEALEAAYGFAVQFFTDPKCDLDGQGPTRSEVELYLNNLWQRWT